MLVSRTKAESHPQWCIAGVLTPVRAIVKLVHLNMNKTFSSVRYTHGRMQPPIPASSPRPELGRVLRARIYGLFNGGRLQIRRAVNQPSSRPHRAGPHNRTVWAIVGGRGIALANKILGARAAASLWATRRKGPGGPIVSSRIIRLFSRYVKQDEG